MSEQLTLEKQIFQEKNKHKEHQHKEKYKRKAFFEHK
jgi:hypothetical protein